MTDREAFKASFLMKCAADGLEPSEVQSRVAETLAAVESGEKSADWKDWLPLGYAGGAVNSAAKTLPYLGLGLPIAAGIGAGYLANAARSEVDKDDVKKQELIEEFRHFARRAREQAKTKALRAI